MDSHNVLHKSIRAPFTVPDPGNGQTILVDRDRMVVELVNSASGETRNLSAPTKAGLFATLELTALTSNYTVAVTVLDSAGATTYTHTFTAAGQFIVYESVCTAWNRTTGAKTFAWQVVSGTLTALGVTVPTQTQHALTDSTGGSAGTTFGAVPAGGTGAAAGAWDTSAHRDAAIAAINDNFASIAAELTKVKADVAGVLSALALMQ